MNLKEAVQAHVQMIQHGQLLEAFERFYADDIVMTEYGEAPRVGKEANRAFEQQFVQNLEAVHGGELRGLAVDEATGLVVAEWFFDVTHRQWGRIQFRQWAIQYWQRGQIVRETFIPIK
jgi:ketosteroid isomerase-like protein